MKLTLTPKTAGLGIVAVAVALLGSAALADKMGLQMMGHGTPAALNFTAIDADKDGKISKDEITAYRAAQAAALDSNSDGKLSVEELAAMHLKRMSEASTTMAERMVERLDTDGDKLLSATEMAARPARQDMFDRIDTSKDGFIDQAEADAAKQAMLDHAERAGGRHGRHHGRMKQDGNMDGTDGMGQDGGN